MKKIKLLLLLLYFSIIGFSQTNTFIIKAIDSKGQIDSVIMGYRDNATVGIDTGLGESDYLDTPYSDIDIRSIQRDSITQYDPITQDSIWLFNSINANFSILPFPLNIDLKKDFRRYAPSEHFVVKVHAKNYPVTIKVGYFDFDQIVPFCSYSDSINGELKYLIYSIGTDTIVIFKSLADNKIIGFHPQVMESIISGLDDISDFTIFPNPVLKTLIINSKINKQQMVFIYDSRGMLMKSQKLQINQNQVDVFNFPNGLYFIRVGFIVKKFIKQ